MTAAAELHTAKQKNFLTRLAETGQVTRSCVEVGWDRVQAYRVKGRDPVFAEAWTDALEMFADRLEVEATRRAVDGTDKGVWHQGVQVGTERQYSDSLLALMLKAKRKREYGDSSKLELSGADGGPVKIEESPTAIGRKIAFALATAMRAKEQEATVEPDDGSDMA